MATQQRSARTPNRVSRRRTTSRLFDKLSKRSKTAMLLAAASLLTVGMVGGRILTAKERQSNVVRKHSNELGYRQPTRSVKFGHSDDFAQHFPAVPATAPPPYSYSQIDLKD